MITHPDDETLEAYIMQMLPGMQQTGLKRHLLLCRRCRHRLIETRHYVRAMAAAARRWRRRPARYLRAHNGEAGTFGVARPAVPPARAVVTSLRSRRKRLRHPKPAEDSKADCCRWSSERPPL